MPIAADRLDGLVVVNDRSQRVVMNSGDVAHRIVGIVEILHRGDVLEEPARQRIGVAKDSA